MFLMADLADGAWSQALATAGAKSFSWVFALAVLHHLPGEDLRRSVAELARCWLSPEGAMIVSVWDFLASPKWRKRILPWQAVGLVEPDVDPDDYLLDWREGGQAFRYVHHFTPEALAALAKGVGFSVVETYRSDGEGGRLGLYQVWRNE